MPFSTALGLLVLVVQAAAEPPLFTRADVNVAAAGEASFRRTYTTRLELPWPDCPNDYFSCRRDEVYGQVYRVDFVEETVEITAGSPRIERVDRGRLAVAAAFPVEVEQGFEESLIGHLDSLGVPAYARPRAGMTFLRGPLKQQVLRQSNLPTWLCYEFDGSYSFDLIVPGERGERTFGQGGDVASEACRTIMAAADSALPDTYRTLPDVRSQTRHEIRLSEASTLAGATWADRLAELPATATYDKAQLEPSEKTGGIRDLQDGAFRGHEGRYGDAERDVLLPAAPLDVAAMPMWATRWTFEEVREIFGETPTVDHEPPRSIAIALLPIADPLMDELKRGRTALKVPRDEIVGRTLTLLKREADIGPATVVDVFASPEIWPSTGDWLVLACEPDGSARYGVAPFGPVAEVTNPREACADVWRLLGD